jgi:hypothetical protein
MSVMGRGPIKRGNKIYPIILKQTFLHVSNIISHHVKKDVDLKMQVF